MWSPTASPRSQRHTGFLWLMRASIDCPPRAACVAIDGKAKIGSTKAPKAPYPSKRKRCAGDDKLALGQLGHSRSLRAACLRAASHSWTKTGIVWFTP